MQKNTVEKQIWGIASSSLVETSSSWNSFLGETSCTSNPPHPLQFATHDYHFATHDCHDCHGLMRSWRKMKPATKLPARKKEAERKRKRKTLSLSQLRFQKLHSSWNSTLSVSSVSVSKTQKLTLSRSQLSYSLGVNSLCPSLSPSQLPLTGSGDHRKSGKKFVSHLPLLNKNFPITLYVPCKCIFRNFFF